ncbi:MAG: alpha/beta fold hydrolase [Myxococcaceae bacterium]
MKRLFNLLAVGLAIPLGLAAMIGFRAARAASQYLTPTREKIGAPPAMPRPLEPVSFTTQDGITLKGWWEPGVNGAAVVWVHGINQSRLSAVEEARWLADSGFGVLLFDLRAHGESGDTVCTYGDHEVLDVDAALDFARAQPGVQKLGAVGFSIGASALAAAAASRHDLDAIVLIAPYTTLREAIDSDFATRGLISEKPAEWALERGGVDLDHLKPIDALPKLKAHPLLVIAGDKETDMPMIERLFAAAGPEGQTWLVPGAEHGQYRHVTEAEYKKRLLEFFAPLAK